MLKKAQQHLPILLPVAPLAVVVAMEEEKVRHAESTEEEAAPAVLVSACNPAEAPAQKIHHPTVMAHDNTPLTTLTEVSATCRSHKRNTPKVHWPSLRLRDEISLKTIQVGW